VVPKKASSKARASGAAKTAKASAKVAKKASRKAAAKAPPKAAKKTTKQAKAKKAKKTAAKTSRQKKKPPLTRRELEAFRQMLLEKRRALIGDMTGIQAETIGVGRTSKSGELSNMPTHPADVGSDNYEHEFSLGLLQSERSLLNEIDEALQRIDAGSFGICLGTGQAIRKSRLTARPWAKYCIEYARMIEKGMVRPGSEGPGESSANEEELEEDSAD